MKVVTSCIRVVLLVVLSIGLVACGDSDEKKAQKKAKTKVERYNALVVELKSQQMPMPSWSEADVNAYEAKINEFETLHHQLQKADGKDGVDISFKGNPELFISLARSRIANARGQMRASAVPESSSARTIAMNRYNDLVRELRLQGMPSADWTHEQIDAFEIKVNELETLHNEIVDYASEDGSSVVITGNTELWISNARTRIDLARSVKKIEEDASTASEDSRGSAI